MNKTNKMGFRVVGITATVFIVLFILYWAGRTLLNKDDGAGPAPGQNLMLEERTRDSDGDGMADLYETTFYRTDPKNPDTDGDGLSDRDEIVAGRDPLIPGPEDQSKPETGSQITTTDTFTKQYLALLPDDVPREDILDQVRLEAFVENNKGALLPRVEVRTSPEEGKAAVSAYLDAVSSSHNNQIGIVTSADIESAFRLLVNTQDSQPIQSIIDILSRNLSILEGVTAPVEAADLHKNMIAATQALKLNSERLLYINQDFVGGLIGAKNIESLGSVFQEMANQTKELEVKYGLE